MKVNKKIQYGVFSFKITLFFVIIKSKKLSIGTSILKDLYFLG